MKHLQFLMGHRGIGKSSLLERIQIYQPQALCIDLDEEIIKKHGAIKTIFSQFGEDHFRKLEVTTLREVLQSLPPNLSKVYIALGAGFSGELPLESGKLWVQRDSDIRGNVYSDRPSLDPVTQSMQTPLERWESRTERYRSLATEELTLLEGRFDHSPEEELFFKKAFSDLGGGFTLLPQQVNSDQFASWLEERLGWGLDFVEVRDDLLSATQIEKVFAQKKRPSVLFSFRDKAKLKDSLPWAQKSDLIDWPIEISFDPPEELKNKKVTLSLHSSQESFLHDLKLLSSFEQPVKWSPVVEQLNYLELAHEWQLSRPQERSFLPRSLNGKWQWYRLLQKKQMPLSFWREGFGSAADQPTLLQWVSAPVAVSQFAAVLGSPVRHSESPSFHKKFFAEKGTFLLPIDATEKDLLDGGFAFLQKIGLKWAAVTSPLKTWASQFSSHEESINTLVYNDVWSGISTDRDGLRCLLVELKKAEIKEEDVVVWGGGGLLPLLKDLLPEATFYSHRSSDPRDQAPLEKPQAVIWCVGRWSWELAAHFPSADWSPQIVIDVNYKLDSPGIAYAHKASAKYISGYMMFKAQALKQQEFWQ